MSECGLSWVGGTFFWVGGDECGCMGYYFGWVGVSGDGWVRMGRWKYTLGEWRWGGMSGSEWVGALFDNALSKYIFYITLT